MCFSYALPVLRILRLIRVSVFDKSMCYPEKYLERRNNC